MSGSKVITIKAYPRIHVTLIGMNDVGLRINGGIGFSINEPFIEIKILESKTFDITDNRSVPMDDLQRSRLKIKLEAIRQKLSLNLNVNVVITGSLPTHSGFGSGTIIRLACIEGLLIINEYVFNRDELVQMSGRGGTSGIGIRTYFKGGYVFDIGHKNWGQKLLPSSNKESNPIQTLLISEGNIPKWSIGICYPIHPIPMTDTENQFFSKNTKLKEVTVYETLYHVVYGVLAGIKENDIKLFEKGVKAIQHCEWKKSERDLYFNELQNAEKVLYENGASMVGMSSLGPGLFFWGKDISSVIVQSSQNLRNWNFLNTFTNNLGRLLTIENA
ncbi:hypothetical protein J3L18_23735 [Mucilaginibacter gossypii]|uniref:beta-ribofuranosylaminobenzene 5'-phosphate synthase family protein n=1 Tax=Mucilaginibacter gossypii TaxID=551996 RepID=UPI000DCE8368|nr:MULTISPECIES: beta-ribofuranosylaminobenzene 5'-phosphate synthase family protein [Mucilaginibacter]QTE36117.1 hypothetical protein J3L18_23735 [Mucilaginibacter gossypii]RAV59968.1 beta-ribofuranosylaminobenzene 5'-phosphate synthase [Mucilaginibacter rubeus]